MGRNTLPATAAEVAEVLGLHTPDLYTGHTWRRTCATRVGGRGAATHEAIGWTSEKTQGDSDEAHLSAPRNTSC